MTTPLLRTALEPIVERHRRLRFLAWLAVAFTVCALAGWMWFHSRSLLAAAALGAAWIAWRYTSAWQPDYGALAREIEEKHPRLQHLLRTAVEQEPNAATGKLSYLQMRVVAEAVENCRSSEVLQGVSSGRLAAAWSAFLVAGALLLLGALSIKPAQRNIGNANIAAAEDRVDVEVTPGDISIERGSGFVVLAKFPSKAVPTEASLVVQQENGAEQRSAMVKNFDDPVFGGGLPEVAAPLHYRVDYAGKSTRLYRVQVFDYPRLDHADAKLKFPEYTKLPDKEILDTRRVSAVEGSKLQVDFHLNKPVRKAVLVEKEGKEIPLATEAGRALAKLTDFTVTETATYEVKLEDEDGRASKVPAQFTIEAKPNRKPELKFLAPRGDIRVSPIEEVHFRIEAWDDFGLARVGLEYTVAAANDTKQVILAENAAADARITAEHLLQLEALKLAPDELISWYAWAEDVGPDGKIRRTVSDMYFAEVRPFEEIFRQGDSAEAQQQQQQQRQQSRAGNQATKLAELQKQIISATWNKQREEAGGEKASEQYVKDVPVIRESQGDALDQAKELAEKLEDPKSKGFAETATQEMQKAIDQLTAAAESVKPLPDALKAEQAAYNSLLKLASHEYNVTRRQRSSSSQGEQNSQGMQQQLDELELKKEENRYETQREAQSPEEQEQREQLAVLNRLKELAQRQQDLNEKIKDLQAALQEAKEEKKKEELKRELKRLRDEQQQMLADLDELSSKMEQEQNQARFAEERKRIEQTRNEAQQASESLQRGEASQALASGTRAQQDLQEMRDDLRRKTSKRFAEDMRNMRSNARDLSDRQREIGEALSTAANKPERRTLDGSSEKEKATEQIEKQKGDLQKLTDDMKRVSQEAEGAEPLLSTELYDTLRKAAQDDPARSLDLTRRMAQQGSAQDAQKAEEKARGEIESIREGVERAAEKVLGDEAEALRKARADLDRLTQQVDREITSRTGEDPAGEEREGKGRNAQGDPSGQQGEAADQQNGQPGRGQAQTGERPGGSRAQQGSRQTGERQANAAQGEQPQEGQQPGENAGEPGQKQGQTAANSNRQGQRRQSQQGEPGARGAQDQKEGAQQAEQGQPGEEGQANQQLGNSETAQASQRGPGQERGQGQRRGRQPGDQKPGGEQGAGQQPNDQQPGEEPGQQAGEQSEGQQANAQQPGGQRGGRQQANSGQRGGQRGGQSGEQGQQPGAQQPGGQQPGEQPGSETAQNGPQGEQAGEGSASGGRGNRSQSRGDAQPGNRGERTGANRLRDIADAPRQRGGQRVGGGNGGPWGGGVENLEQAGPLTGEDFVQWSDQLRTVEEMLDDPDLRAEAARIREVAKGVRADFKRHSVDPKWEMVRSQIRTPLAQLRDRVSEELARREKKDALVPIDRDPVPAKFAEQVRKYYENLGRSTPKAE